MELKAVPGAFILGLPRHSGVSLVWLNCLLLDDCVSRADVFAELEIPDPALNTFVLGHLFPIDNP